MTVAVEMSAGRIVKLVVRMPYSGSMPVTVTVAVPVSTLSAYDTS